MPRDHWRMLLALPLLVIACGKTSDGADGSAEAGTGAGASASCEDVTPCGGDVVGSWTVVDSCLTIGAVTDLKYLALHCTSAPTTGSLEVTGTWNASLDGTVSDHTHTSGASTFDTPIECTFTPKSPRATCDSLSEAMAPIIGAASLDCVDSETAWCACSATFAQNGSIGSISSSPLINGSYTTVDGVLTVSDGVKHTEYAYCSVGNTLALSLRSAGKAGTVTGTILLQRH